MDTCHNTTLHDITSTPHSEILLPLVSKLDVRRNWTKVYLRNLQFLGFDKVTKFTVHWPSSFMINIRICSLQSNIVRVSMTFTNVFRSFSISWSEGSCSSKRINPDLDGNSLNRWDGHGRRNTRIDDEKLLSWLK